MPFAFSFCRVRPSVAVVRNFPTVIFLHRLSVYLSTLTLERPASYQLSDAAQLFG
jgi:hypothetical protein